MMDCASGKRLGGPANRCVKESDGDLRSSDGLLFEPIHTLDACIHYRQQFWRVQLPPRLFGDPEHFPDDRLGSLHALVAGGCIRAERRRLSNWIHDVSVPLRLIGTYYYKSSIYRALQFGTKDAQ
jgi:hypothetical protein